jgi:hypothetical protein
MRLGQLVVGDAPIIILFESLEADRAENFLGRAELGEQPLKVVGTVDTTAELVRKLLFGSSRRTDHQDVTGG